jgi:hypothetical protein
VSVTPDCRRAVSVVTDNKTLSVWDLESGACLHTLEGLSDKVWVGTTYPYNLRCAASVKVTPDGRRAVSVGKDDKTLRLWDLEGGKCLHTLEGHSGSIWSVSVTPDGRRAVSGGHDKTLRAWDLETGKCLRILEGHSSFVGSVSVTPDGLRAVSGSLDNTLRVWDLESGACLRTIEGHSSEVRSVSVTPDGLRAVSGSLDNTLRVWDLESADCIGVFFAGVPVNVGPTFGSGMMLAGSSAGEMLFLELTNVPSGPPVVKPFVIEVDKSDRNYEMVLRRGLEHSRRKANNDSDTLGHLTALITLLQAHGETEEVAALLLERNEMAARLAAAEAAKKILDERVERDKTKPFQEHLKELICCLSIPIWFWFFATLAVMALVGLHDFGRAVTAPLYGLAITYPVFCVCMLRFAYPALQDKEIRLATLGLCAFPVLVSLVGALLWPVELLWLALCGDRLATSFPLLIAKVLTCGVFICLCAGILRSKNEKLLRFRRLTSLAGLLCLLLPAVVWAIVFALLAILVMVLVMNFWGIGSRVNRRVETAVQRLEKSGLIPTEPS